MSLPINPANAVPRSPQPPENRLVAVSLGTLGIVFILVAMAFWVAPPLAERIQYSRTLGERRALQESPTTLELDTLNRGSAHLAKIMLPTVVHIDTRRSGVRSERTIFGNLPRRYEAMGEASGVIVDPAGYIVTNSHVVAGSDRLEVKIDGREKPVPAEVIGVDEEVDLAVIKVEASNLVAATWGDSSALEVGEFVWAIGTPFGLDGSVSLGIISAKGRRLAEKNGDGEAESTRANDFLQTDAAINPGNSGGPLVNFEGKVIGINTAIVGPTNQGIGFAIPSEIAKTVYQRLRDSQGKVPVSKAPGYLGVSMQAVTPEVAQILALPEPQGALVTGILSNSPAAKAGIKRYDVVTRWNGQPVNDPLSLAALVGKTPLDKAVEVVVVRDGRQQTLAITVERRPKQ